MVEVYIDGASSGNPGPSGIGICIPSTGFEYKEHIGIRTNNYAEAYALLKALELLDSDKFYTIYTDSQLVHGHLMLDWKVNKPQLKAIYEKIRMVGKDIKYELKMINSKANRADKLAKSASKMDEPKDKLLEHATPMAYEHAYLEGTDDSKREDREPTTDASKALEKGIVTKPYYRLHHDMICRSITIYKYPVGIDGRPIEMGAPQIAAEISEEAAIQLIIMSKMGQLKVSE